MSQGPQISLALAGMPGLLGGIQGTTDALRLQVIQQNELVLLVSTYATGGPWEVPVNPDIIRCLQSRLPPECIKELPGTAVNLPLAVRTPWEGIPLGWFLRYCHTAAWREGEAELRAQGLEHYFFETHLLPILDRILQRELARSAAELEAEHTLWTLGELR